MILYLVLLLFLNIPKEIFGIYCVYNEDSSEWSLDDFNDDEFKIKVDTFPNYDYKDNFDACRVEIYIDYKSRLLIISFGNSFEPSQLNHGEGRLDFLIKFNQNNSDAEIYHVLEYSCYDYDQCNKFFVFDHIQWLKNVNYTSFQFNLRSILFNSSNKTERCFKDKINLFNCSSNVCSGKYSSYHENYLFECHQNSKAFVEVHITTNMIVMEENHSNDIYIDEHKIIRYTCKFDQCNNQLLTNELIHTVEKEYQLSSMRDALSASYRPNKKPLTTSNLTYQTKYPIEIKQSSSSKTTFFNNAAKKILIYHLNLILCYVIIYFTCE